MKRLSCPLLSTSILLVSCIVASAQQESSVPVGTSMTIESAVVPIRVLVQDPAETRTELQIICLFKSATENTLHGSLLETNAKLSGLLDHIRNASLFRGDLGQTILIVPPAGTIGAKKLLIIGLGDSKTFTPELEQLVGWTVYTEANRMRVAHPFFAPTVLDGGVSRYTTEQLSEQMIEGFLLAAATEKAVKDANAADRESIVDLTYLAGQQHANSTRQGIETAIAAGQRLK